MDSVCYCSSLPGVAMFRCGCLLGCQVFEKIFVLSVSESGVLDYVVVRNVLRLYQHRCFNCTVWNGCGRAAFTEVFTILITPQTLTILIDFMFFESKRKGGDSAGEILESGAL